MADKKRIDEATGTETMGHEWDGIEELEHSAAAALVAVGALRLDRLGHRLHDPLSGLAAGQPSD